MKATRAMPKLSEAGWLAQVLELAELYRWQWHHDNDSRREVVSGGESKLVGDQDAADFPDLVLWRDRVIFRELKSDTGTLTPGQRRCLEALRLAGADVDVWRPRDLDRVQDELYRRGPVVADVTTGERL